MARNPHFFSIPLLCHLMTSSHNDITGAHTPPPCTVQQQCNASTSLLQTLHSMSHSPFPELSCVLIAYTLFLPFVICKIMTNTYINLKQHLLLLNKQYTLVTSHEHNYFILLTSYMTYWYINKFDNIIITLKNKLKLL